MALSTDKNLEMMFPNVGHIIPAKSNIPATYYKGALVDFDPNGYIVVAADVANHTFAGIVKEQVVVGAGETKDIEAIAETAHFEPRSGNKPVEPVSNPIIVGRIDGNVDAAEG